MAVGVGSRLDGSPCPRALLTWAAKPAARAPPMATNALEVAVNGAVVFRHIDGVGVCWGHAVLLCMSCQRGRVVRESCFLGRWISRRFPA